MGSWTPLNCLDGIGLVKTFGYFPMAIDSHILCSLQMVHGYLRASGCTIQRQRVRDSLIRVDPEGTASRWKKAIKRRVYKVATPNTMWHMDSHMKLIR